MQRHFSRNVALVGSLVLLQSLLFFAQKNGSSQESAPDVPDAIAVPAGLQPVLFVHAAGSQIYTCKAGADGKFGWALKGPEAELKDRNDKVIGSHSAGPTWKLNDGSELTGKMAAQVPSLDEDSIPWLLVNVATAWEVCDEAHKDSETKSKYTADYYFFAPAP